ncbi:MAG: hypothetical protein GQ574_11890 [Crocinitomix sp.]|nr:hypothetical protein [Crocinitomix sp.]
MRLSVLTNGHSFLQKVQIKIITKIIGQTPSPILVLSYKKKFFGKHYTPWLQNSLRKTNHWTIGEVELMGVYISKSNGCEYCTADHIAVAKNALDESVIRAVLTDIDTAPIDVKMKAVLKFLNKLCVSPNEVSKRDIMALKNEGLDRDAIEEAIHVCGIFSVMNRLADAFDFEMSTDLEKVGEFLFKKGYGGGCLRG